MERIRVVVVDDSLTIRAMVEQLLGNDREFESVSLAGDVPSAIDLIKSVKPHVITLDLAMPGIGGIRFLDDLNGRWHAPVIVVSSATTEGSDAAEEAIAHGAEACFDKANVVAEAEAFAELLKKVARQPTAERIQADAIAKLTD